MSDDDSPFVVSACTGRGPFESLVGDEDENLPLRTAQNKLGVPPERLVALACAVAFIRGERGLGCGFLLEGNQLVTCCHVLPDARALAAARISFNRLDERGRSTGLVDVRALDGTFHSDAALDWAVVRVASAGPGELPTPLRRATRGVQAGDRMVMIHRKNGALVRSDEWSPVARDDAESRLRHEADTYGGSSGAPVFNTDWEVVAIHTGSGPADLSRLASVLYNRATALKAVPT